MVRARILEISNTEWSEYTSTTLTATSSSQSQGRLTDIVTSSTVDDVVDAFMLAGSDRETDNQVFNVATGVRTTVRELIDLLSAEYGFAAGTYPVTRAEGHPGDIFGNAGATGKLEALGWEARYDLTAGIQRTVDWLRHPGGRGT